MYICMTAQTPCLMRNEQKEALRQEIMFWADPLVENIEYICEKITQVNLAVC